MVSNYQSIKQQMQTIHQNHNTVLMRKVLQVSGLIRLKHQGVKQSFNLFIISSA